MDIRDGMEVISLCSFLKEQPVFAKRVFPQSSDLSVSAEQILRSIECVSADVKDAEPFQFFMEYIRQLKTSEGSTIAIRRS